MSPFRTSQPAPPGPFREVADRVWVARYDWFDVNVTVVGGSAGLLVVDTWASTTAGRQLVADVRALAAATGAGEVLGVVNTHAHFDHCFGNAALVEAWPDAPVHAHEGAVAELAAALHDTDPDPDALTGDPRREEVLATEVLIPTHTFSSAVAVDLGDRRVELVHPGRGHTSGDLVVCVPDADVVVAGDLLEQAGPPVWGADSFPLEWAGSLDVVLGLTGAGTVLVPGHGDPVDRDFAEEQRHVIGGVAAVITDLAAAGVSEADAPARGHWPVPVEQLGHAVARGFAHLPRGSRRLPMA